MVRRDFLFDPWPFPQRHGECHRFFTGRSMINSSDQVMKPGSTTKLAEAREHADARMARDLIVKTVSQQKNLLQSRTT